MNDDNSQEVGNRGGDEESFSTDLSDLKARLAGGSQDKVGSSRDDREGDDGEGEGGRELGLPKDEEISKVEMEKEEEGGKREEDATPYLGEEPPSGKVNWTKWALLHGLTESEIEARGINPNTIRICAHELEKDGYRKRPKKGRELAAYGGPTRGIQIFAKGGPPEALIDAIHIPLDGEHARAFEQGLKTGASLLVLGVRVAQELSTVGIQQAKPIMEMAREMRAGEAAAAKDAASEAAEEAAQRVAQIFGPSLSEARRPPTDTKDPMRAMLARAMEPMVQQMMRMFMPALPIQKSSSWEVIEE